MVAVVVVVVVAVSTVGGTVGGTVDTETHGSFSHSHNEHNSALNSSD